MKVTCLMQHTNTNKKPRMSQNGPSVSQLKISSGSLTTVRSPQRLRKAVLQSQGNTTWYQIFYCERKQLQKAFICPKESVPFEAEQKPKISQATINTFKTSISNSIFIRTLFFSTLVIQNPRSRFYIYINIYKNANNYWASSSGQECQVSLSS